MTTDALRARVVAALEFPRALAQDQMELEDCTHAGIYRNEDLGCQHCDQRPQCQWLYRSEEREALASKPLPRLAEVLDFAIFYVDAWRLRNGHDHDACPCPACSWVREARPLHDALSTGH